MSSDDSPLPTTTESSDPPSIHGVQSPYELGQALLKISDEQGDREVLSAPAEGTRSSMARRVTIYSLPMET